MKNLLKSTVIFLLVSLLTACATHKTQYNKTEEKWQQQSLPTKPLEHQIFLVGDALGENTTTLKALNEKVKRSNQKSSVIFLGDNFSTLHSPSADQNGSLHQQELKKELDLLKNYTNQLYVLPSEQDWHSLSNLQQTGAWVNSFFAKKNAFILEDGCSGPIVKELSNSAVLIAIDSQWYLENWDNKKGINENCEWRTRGLFLRELMDKIKDNRHKNIILAMHHPLNSNGRYGGHYPAKEHLFPLTNKQENLLVPLPGIGTIAAFANNAIGTRQELRHPNYQLLKEQLIDMADKYTNVIFASGHEHSLQYFEEEDQHFIVSGAGASQTPVALGGDASFVAGVKGFSNLNVYKDGEVWVEFWATSNEKGEDLVESQLIFRKKVRPALPSDEELTPDEYPEYERLKNQDSILMSVMEKEDLKIHNQTFWGKLYTQEYLTDFKMPILNLAKAKGGLHAISIGGGNQTNSIRLKNEAGKFYQLRSVQKVTERFPGIIRKTFANELAKQGLTAGNPFSALVVGSMATAINVFHTNPKMVYVPKQPNLGTYNNLGGAVYLFEERGNGDWSDLASFGYTKKVENMGNVIERKLKNRNTQIDQPQVLRSRLFDMILGDWDRHTDQWRWAEFKMKDGKRLYKPIPRDRDQVYAKFDGIANTLANYTVPFTRAADKYDGEIGKGETTWLNYQARHFDRLFLAKMTLKDWEREAKFIQQNLSDEVIDQAIKNLPPFSYDKDGEKLSKWTKMRRDNLLEVARNYYKILNKEVNIFGTHQENSFHIERLNDFQTKVVIYEIVNKTKEQVLIYERIFETDVTKELRLYGLNGNDQFKVEGKVNKGILLRLIGGHGADDFEDESTVKGLKRRTKIYDDLGRENSLSLGSEGKDNRTKRSILNTFDYLDYEYDYMIPIPLIGSNPDDGLFVSLNLNWNTFSFKRNQIHKITGNYAIGTGGFSFGYEADYFNTFNYWDTYLKVVAEVPRFVANFHGLGNETIRNLDEYGRDYYRVKRTLFGIYPAIKKRTDAGITFSIGPTLESVKIEELADHITNDNIVRLRPEVFDNQYFAGSDISFNFFNTDHKVVPTQGLGFTTAIEWRANLKDRDRQLLRLKSGLILYFRLSENDRLVLSNQVGGEHLIGDFDFFQAVNLGGSDNLRGFAEQRFSGQTSFFHNIDLRIKLFDSENNSLPISGGITPSFDYGRVWIGDNTSDKWHVAYGGTIWFAPLDYIALSAGMFFSDEENRLLVKAGIQF